MSNAQDFVNSFMDKLAGTATLTPALKNIFSTILAKQVTVVGSEVTFGAAFEQFAKIFTFISTPAADRPATPVSYDATQIADAKNDAAAENSLTVGGEAPDTPVDTSSLTAALKDLSEANDTELQFLKDNIDNALLAENTVIKGKVAADQEVTAEDVRTAIKAEKAGAAAKLVTANDTLLDAKAAVAAANALVASTTTTIGTVASLNLTDTANALTSITLDITKLSDANLATALAEAQANINKSAVKYTAEGLAVTVPAPLAGLTELKAVYKIAAGDVIDKTSLIADSHITEDFPGTQQTTVATVTIADGNKLSFVLNGVTHAFTATDVTESPTVLTDMSPALPTGYEVEVTSTALTFKGPAGVSFDLTDVENITTPAATIATAAEATAMTFAEIIADKDVTLEGYTDGTLGFTNPLDADTVKGEIKSDENAFTDTTASQDSGIYLAKDLQARVGEKSSAVEAFEASNGNNVELLTNLREAITSFVAAEGDVAAKIGSETVIKVRTDIKVLLDALANATNATDASTAQTNIDSAIATYADAAVNAATDVVSKTNPTAAELLVGSALESIIGRNTADEELKTAEKAFAGTSPSEVATGKVYSEIESLIKAKAALNEAVAAAEEAVITAEESQQSIDALSTELTNLEKAVKAAEDYITNPVEPANEGDLPGLEKELITLDIGSKNATKGDDLFLLKDIDSTITNFNVQGEDTIYVGTDYTLFKVAGKALTKDDGDVAVREAIIVDDGTKTTIYFEDKAFAGQTSSLANDSTVITLTGVTGVDLDINADGFLTIA